MRYLTKTRPESMMDHFFDSMFYNTPQQNNVYSSFPVDITEEGDKYSVLSELPGFSDGDVEITLNDNMLVISAEKEKKEEGDREYKYLLRERVERRYKRTFSLPKDADRENIKASMHDGVLSLDIGKKPEAKPVTIKIN